MILVYVTNKDENEAKKLVSHLLDRKLIACANIFPIRSFYLWKGTKEDSNEAVSLLKTKNSNWEKLKSEILNIHPYDVPCIIKLEAESNEGYEKWIDSEMK